MRCPKCNSRIPDDSIFCEECGINISEYGGGISDIKPPTNSSPDYMAKNISEHRKKAPVIKIVIGAFLLIALVISVTVLLKKKPQYIADRNDTALTTATEDNNEDYEPVDNVNKSEGAEEAGDAETKESDTSAEDIKNEDDSIKENGYDTEGIGGIEDLDDEKMLSIAEENSTDENAAITDIEWFYIYTDGADAERSDLTKEWVRIDDMPLLLNGGWKAYTTSDIYGGETERYFNVHIDTDGKNFKATLNWATLFDKTSGESITESGSDTFKGKWDKAKGTAKLKSSFATIEFDNFYMKPYYENYGVGWIDWISGEREYLILTR